MADAAKGRDHSSFSIIPENIQNLPECHEDFPRKSTRRLSKETGILRTSVLRILHDDLKLFLYKIQILRRQTDQNKAKWETFCEDISQRIENDPGLLDLNNLNNVDHCGLCGASATLPVSRNLATKRWIVLLSGTLFLPKSFLHCRCVRRTDFSTKNTWVIFIRCCVVNHLVGSILVSKESPRPAVSTTWKIWKKIVKHNFGMKNKIERFFWTTLQLKNMRPIFIKIVKYKVCLNKSWAISFINIGFLAWILWKYIRST